MPPVSVVVSIHKVAPYLRDCLDSIVAQTYTDIEILCIVNDSPDECENIARSYEKDSRLRVIVQNHIGGLGGARNLGLSHSRGQYILFVDGDDVLSKDYIRLLYEGTSQSSTIDIVYTPNIVVFTNTSTARHQNTDEILLNLKDLSPKIEMSDVIASSFEEKIENALQSPWGHSTANKLFRKSFLAEKSLRFPTKRVHEDGVFSLYAWALSRDVLFLSPEKSLFYFYRKRPHSITASQKTGFVDAYQTFLEACSHPDTPEEFQALSPFLGQYLHLLTLHWIFNISCHELRNGGWLLYPVRFFHSVQIEKSLFRFVSQYQSLPFQGSELHKIWHFFQRQNPLSKRYYIRKIYWILRKNRNNPLRFCKDKISWSDLKEI